ncbi:MAG: ABC transporter ATP-binding protein, partial [Gammaproteobacteria bacterium]|nr:ABC transporter ATP-binding protein [Gammaproteobacteria bacterium]
QSLIDAVDALHGEKTIIMVAHRLRTVRHTDRVLFFSEGKLRDAGGFEELNQRNEQFRRIAELE